jgi:hypothetical protein
MEAIEAELRSFVFSSLFDIKASALLRQLERVSGGLEFARKASAPASLINPTWARLLPQSRNALKDGNRKAGLVAENTEDNGEPGRTRTCDPLLRRQMLYPPELRARTGLYFSSVLSPPEEC